MASRRGAGTIFALRRQIAKIEGRLPNGSTVAARPATPRASTCAVTASRRPTELFLPPAPSALDAALGGGLPGAALTEIHGAETRDAGAVAGFVLALVRPVLKGQGRLAAPLDRHVGDFPRGRLSLSAGLARFRHRPEALLLSEAPKLADALWIAEEAARLDGSRRGPLEMRGNPARLDLTATRRLHRRAQHAGRPVFLLRQAAQAEPTAAPVRLVVSPAPAARARTLAGPLAGSIGPPAFTRRRSARTAPRRPANSYWSGTPMNSPFRKDSRRILALWFPHLSTERILRQRLGRSWRSRRRRRGCRWSSAIATTTPSASPPSTSRLRR